MFKQLPATSMPMRHTVQLTLFLLVFFYPKDNWACLELPVTPPDMDIETCVGFEGFTYLRFLDYATYGANEEDFCTCALNLPFQFGEVVAATIVHAGTNTPVDGWNFVADADSDFGAQSNDWQGFSSEVNAIIPVDLAVDVLFIINPFCFDYKYEYEDEDCCIDNGTDIEDWFINGDGLIGTDGANEDGSPGGDHFFVGKPDDITIVFPLCDDIDINGDELGVIVGPNGEEINCGGDFCPSCELQFTELSDPCSCASTFVTGLGFRDTLTITVVPGDDAVLEVNNEGFRQGNGALFLVGTIFVDGGAFDNDGIVNGQIIVPFIREELEIADIVVNGVAFQSPEPCPELSTCFPPNNNDFIMCPPDQMVSCGADAIAGMLQTDTICSLDDIFIDLTGPIILGQENCDGTTYTFQFIASDLCDNIDTCFQTFTIQNDPPMIVCPADTSVVCPNDFVPGTPQVVTSCGLNSDLLITISDLPDPACAGGTFSVIYEATDDCGRSSFCEQIVTIEDNPGLTMVSCPADTMITCVTDIRLGVVEFTSFCDVDANISISSPVLVGTPNCPGATYTFTYTVTDLCGNSESCDQVFTIASNPNSTIIMCSDNETVSCESEIRPTTPSFETACGIGATITKVGPVVSGMPGQNGTTYTYTFTVTDVCGGMASCEQVFTIENQCTNLDFDALTPGTIVTNQFARVSITTDNPQNNPAMIFDTGNPTGNDFDLGTPNELSGGPGEGLGFCNSEFQGNALIITKDLNTPNETEGQLIFNFDCAVFLRSIDFLDMECDHNTVSLFDRDGDLIESITLPQFGENSFHTEILNINGVYSMIIDFPCAGGAITDVVFCEDGTPGATCGICDDATLDFRDDNVDWIQDDMSGSFTNGFQQFDIMINDPDQIFEGSEESESGIQIEMDPTDVAEVLEIKYTLSETSSFVVFDIVDLDFKDHGSRQQEMVCICGINSSAGPDLIFPTIVSLDGSVEIDGNCAIATDDSASSRRDESVLVKFTECVDEIIIKYGAGPDSPINDPDFSKIQIGRDFGFMTSRCPNDCAPCDLIGDVDMDGICDDCDICLNGDDSIDTDGDGIPDACDSDCENSVDEGDDDLDGVCNIDDVCPGGNDQIDTDGNGVPDDCEECEEFTLVFGCTNEWVDNSLSGSFTVLEQTFDISIMNMDGILENTNQEGFGLNVGIDPVDVNDVVTIKYALSEVANNVMFDIVDLDFKDGNSRQQEAVCIYGFLDTIPDPILPVLTSLDGSVSIIGNCAEATANSSQSRQDESIMVVFEDCINMIVIEYGTGSNSPTDDPDFSNITIGLDLGFKTEVCEHLCLPECPGGRVLTGVQSETAHYQAFDKIESNQIIEAPDVIYGAYTEVELQAGFRVMSGSVFEANLNGCDNP